MSQDEECIAQVQHACGVLCTFVPQQAHRAIHTGQRSSQRPSLLVRPLCAPPDTSQASTHCTDTDRPATHPVLHMSANRHRCRCRGRDAGGRTGSWALLQERGPAQTHRPRCLTAEPCTCQAAACCCCCHQCCRRQCWGSHRRSRHPRCCCCCCWCCTRRHRCCSGAGRSVLTQPGGRRQDTDNISAPTKQGMVAA